MSFNFFYTTQLEGHSVERMYLRQRCSDGSVNKTILKPHLAAAAGRQYVYVRFSRRKIPRSSAYTILEKAIRFWHPDYNPHRAQKLISSSMSRHMTTRNILSKSMNAFLSNLANRQTDKRTRAKTCRWTNTGKNIFLCRRQKTRAKTLYVPPPLYLRKISSKSVHNFFRYPAEIQKSTVNPVPGSGLWSGSSSKPNQFVQAPTAIDPLNLIEIRP